VISENVILKEGKGVILDKKIILNNYELRTFILEEIQITLKKTENFSKIP
jgi:hypothetical protein